MIFKTSYSYMLSKRYSLVCETSVKFDVDLKIVKIKINYICPSCATYRFQPKLHNKQTRIDILLRAIERKTKIQNESNRQMFSIFCGSGL